MHEFSQNATIAKNKDHPNTGKAKIQRSASNTTPENAKERLLIKLQRPCITLYKHTLLGQEMMEIGAAQSKSAPESKLSYPADPLTNMHVVDLGPHIPSPTPIFTRGNC